MNKILRYSFVALLAMVFGNVMADEATMKYSGSTTANMKADGSNEAASVGLNDSEWSVVASKGAASNAPGLNKAGDIRLYWHADGGNTITVSSLTNATISNIAITFTGAEYSNVSVTANGAAVTGTDGNYAINSTSFILGNANTSSAQVRISQIVITYAGGTPVTVVAPKFSVESGLYFETQTVALTCETAGAKILYTIPAGQDPEYTDDNNFTGVFYDGTPLTISQNTIIKAMAIKDGQTSNIVTAKYTIVNTTGKGTAESPFSVADALLVVNALENGATTAEKYFVKGYIVGAPDFQRNSDQELYGNCNFDIADVKGGSEKLTIYRAKSFENKNFTEDDVTAKIIEENDLVTLEGQLQKYVKDEAVTPELKNGFLISVVKGEELPPLPELPTVEAQPVLKFTANGQWASYTFNKGDFYAKDYKGFRIEYSNMNTVESGAAFNILINSAETHLGKDWKGDDAQVPNKTAYKNWEFDSNHTVFVGDFSDFVVTDDPNTTCPTITQFALQACDAGNTVIIKKVVFIKQDDTEILPEYKGDDWGGGAYTVEEVTDGINNVTTAKAENAVRYNLAGQKVNNDYKGVVIMNGKKMLNK
jgi:hypothetical protein